MRKAHKGLDLSKIWKDDYSNLPEELREFNYYYDDEETGHVIMAIPECLLNKAEEVGDLDAFECPFPVKYVLEKGYRMYKDHVICEGKYDPVFGLEIEEGYGEL